MVGWTPLPLPRKPERGDRPIDGISPTWPQPIHVRPRETEQPLGAREFFDSVRAAVIDAERCRWQLDAMESQALSVGSPSFDAHVRGGERDRIGRDVAAMVDRESELNGRIESDYLLIDTACEILYGKDGMSDGLAALAPSPWWADAIYHRYLGLRTWPEVAELLGVTARSAQKGVRAAFDIADGYGLTATVAGVGHAEG